MKVVLDSKFKKYAVTILEDSSSDEDPQIVDIEHHRVDQTLEGISIEMEHISELPKEGHKDKGKKKIYEFEMGMYFKSPNMEKLEQQEIPARQTIMETLSEVEVIKPKSLQYYKAQNGYLNDSNDQLMLENRRLREDMEETNTSYQELITSSKEVLRRKKLSWQKNEELISQNKEIQGKIQTMDAEYSRLQKRSWALNGLKMLVEAARKILLFVF